MCSIGQDAKVSILAERGAKEIEATKSQQQKAEPEHSWFYRGKMKGSLEK